MSADRPIRRALRRINATLVRQYDKQHEDAQTAVVDLLADLHHYADVHALDLTALMATAQMHYRAEKADTVARRQEEMEATT